MNAQHHRANPFALMMNPQDVLRAVEHSDRLQRLQRRICRPLDKPLIPHALSDLELFDRTIDDTVLDDDDTGFALTRC